MSRNDQAELLYKLKLKLEGTPTISQTLLDLPYYKTLNQSLDDVFNVDDAAPKTKVKRAISGPNMTLNLPSTGFKFPAYDAKKVLTDEEGLNLLKNFSLYNANGKNLVRDRAENYFIEGVLYHTDEAILTLFSLSRAGLAIPATRVKIITETNAAAFYKSFSIPFFAHLVSLSTTTVADKIDKEKTVAAMQRCMSQASGNVDVFSQQATLLFNYAFCEKNQWMQTFLKKKSYWSFVYFRYLRSNDFLAKWGSRHARKDKRTRADYHAEVLNIKATLNLLDPTMVMSNSAIFYLNVHAMFYYMAPYIKKSDILNNIITTTVPMIVEKLQNASGYTAVMKDFIGASGSVNGAINEVAKAFTSIQYTSLDGLDVTKGPTQYIEDLGSRICDLIKASMPSFTFTTVFKYAMVCAFRCLQGFMIGYCMANKDSLDTWDKGYFTADAIGIVLDVCTTYNPGNEGFTEIGVYLGRCLRTVPIDKVQTVLNYIFVEDAAKFILNRYTPTLLLASTLKTLYDSFMDVLKGSFSQAVLDSATTLMTAGAAYLLFAEVSWSGPLALLTGITVAGVQGAKYVFFSEASPSQQFYDNYLTSDYKKA